MGRGERGSDQAEEPVGTGEEGAMCGKSSWALTWALTSTCPVLSSRLTISKFPILAA